MGDELSEQEIANLAKVFKDLKVKPKADSTKDFTEWMKEFVGTLPDGTHTVKTEPDVNETQDSATKSVIQTPYVPKLSVFMGDGRKEDNYDLWHYEVECLIKAKYSEGVIAQAIRRSLKSEASKVIMQLGPEATASQMLHKMDNIFGNLERGENIMEEFYRTSQQKGEDSISWSCRLEEIFRRALMKGIVKADERNEKLRSRFWHGLNQWLKDITSYKYDTILDFDD